MGRLRRIYDDYHPVYFITAKTFENRKIFDDEKKVKILFKVIEYLLRKRYFKLYAWVILPDHFHLLLEITGEKNISEVMHDLKSYATHQISGMIITHRKRGFHASPKQLTNRRSVEASAPEGGKYVKIWQPSFYDHIIRNQNDFNNHANYIYFNPVKHGYVSKPEDWPWPSYSN